MYSGGLVPLVGRQSTRRGRPDCWLIFSRTLSPTKKLGANCSLRSWMWRWRFVAATYLSDDALPKIMLKKIRSAKLSGEEEKAWMTAWRSAGLLQTYGKKAGLVLAARGVGATTATRILRNRSGGEDSLYLSILRAER